MFESYFRKASRTRSSSGAFAGECAEQLIESRELCTAARRCGCRAGAAHGKASTHRFCAAKLLALKSIGFLMTGKKKARRNAPAFQALFSQHGAKRLTFKRCLLAFLWAQFAFLLQAFSFSNKKKMPKRGIYIIRLECVVKAEANYMPLYRLQR